MMDSQSRDDEGELIFTEFEGQVLDRLDRIIALLTPSTYTITTTPNITLGYTCARCKTWVPRGQTHMCSAVQIEGTSS